MTTSVILVEMDLVVLSAPKGIAYHTNSKPATELATHHRKQRNLEQGVNFLVRSNFKQRFLSISV